VVGWLGGVGHLGRQTQSCRSTQCIKPTRGRPPQLPSPTNYQSQPTCALLCPPPAPTHPLSIPTPHLPSPERQPALRDGHLQCNRCLVISLLPSPQPSETTPTSPLDCLLSPANPDPKPPTPHPQTLTVRLAPISDPLTCAGMSSGPSSSWRYIVPSGAMRSSASWGLGLGVWGLGVRLGWIGCGGRIRFTAAAAGASWWKHETSASRGALRLLDHCASATQAHSRWGRAARRGWRSRWWWATRWCGGWRCWRDPPAQVEARAVWVGQCWCRKQPCRCSSCCCCCCCSGAPQTAPPDAAAHLELGDLRDCLVDVVGDDVAAAPHLS